MYTLIINQPGYLPESEPVVFNTVNEAWSYAADEIERDWEDYAAPVGMSFVEHHRKMQEFSRAYAGAMEATGIGHIAAPNGYVYTVEVYREG